MSCGGICKCKRANSQTSCDPHRAQVGLSQGGLLGAQQEGPAYQAQGEGLDSKSPGSEGLGNALVHSRYAGSSAGDDMERMSRAGPVSGIRVSSAHCGLGAAWKALSAWRT